MSNKVNVLDHGFVRLVSYMQPAPDYDLRDDPEFGGTEEDLLIDAHKGWRGDLEIVRNARVSYNADWRTGTNEGSDDKLLRSLHARGHTSPFEAMVFTFEVKAPIFVFRQWHRHRTWSYNELSARYAPMQEEFYVPKAEHIGYQDRKEKQGKTGVHEYAYRISDEIHNASVTAHDRYRQLLVTGMTREQARLIVPVNTYSRMFATVDLHNLFHFLRLRLDSHAQYEIRVYAEALLKLIEPICPVAVAAFKTELMHEPLTPNELQAVRRAIDAEIEMTTDFEVVPQEDQAYVDFLKSALDKISEP